MTFISPAQLLIAKTFIGSNSLVERPSSPTSFHSFPKKLDRTLAHCDINAKSDFLVQFEALSNDDKVAFQDWFSKQTSQRQLNFINQGELISDLPELLDRRAQERACRLSCLIHRIEHTNSKMFPWEAYQYISRAIPANIRGKVYDQLFFSNPSHVKKLCFRLNEIESQISEKEMLKAFNYCFKPTGLSILSKDFMVVSTKFMPKDLHIYDDGKKVAAESFDYPDNVAYRCIGRLTKSNNTSAGFFLFTIFPESLVLHEDLICFDSDVTNALQQFDPLLRQLCSNLGLGKISLTADHAGRYVHAKRDGIQFYQSKDANRVFRALKSFLASNNIQPNDVWVGQQRAHSFDSLRELINKSPLAFTQLKWTHENTQLDVVVREGFDNNGNEILSNQNLPLSKAFLLANGVDNSWRGKIII